MRSSTRPRGPIGRFERQASLCGSRIGAFWGGLCKGLSGLVLCIALCFGLGIFFTARPAAAQDFAAAGQHFAAAQDAFAQGQYKRAAEEYQAAFDITRDGALLFNIGESWQRAGDNNKALVAYREYIKDQPGGSERAEAEKRIQSIENGTAPPPEPNQGNTPVSGVPTEKLPPSAPAQPEKITPSVSTAPQPVPVSPGGAPLKPSRLRTAAWISVAVAVALATAGAILGLGAQNRSDELQRRTTVLLNNQPPLYDDNQRQAYEALVSEGKAYNTASIALLSIAGATAVTGVALFIADYVTRSKRDSKNEKNRLAGEMRPALRIGANQAILTVGGSF